MQNNQHNFLTYYFFYCFLTYFTFSFVASFIHRDTFEWLPWSGLLVRNYIYKHNKKQTWRDAFTILVFIIVRVNKLKQNMNVFATTQWTSLRLSNKL